MITDSEMYAEVFEILSYMEKQEVMRIPEDILKFIKDKKSKSYKSRIDKNDVLNPDNIDQRTIDLLTGLIVNYMANEEEKERIIKIGKENTKRREEEKKEKYSNKVFASKKLENNVIENTTNETHLIVEERSDSIFTVIMNFFKKLFKKKH